MSDHEQERTAAEEPVVTKYTTAGEIVNRVTQHIVGECVAGASVRGLCAMGDAMMEKELKTVYKKEKDLSKGIAFPLAVSVNNCINHYSPLFSDKDLELKDGDVVKLDLGAHIDEFIAVLGHTVVVGASPQKKVEGRRADVMMAAHFALQAAIRLVKPGNDNLAVCDAINKVANSYKCKPIDGTCSFQLQQGKIEGEKVIIQNPSDAHKKATADKVDFKTHEVYAVDVVVSTGTGKGKELETRTTIYKKSEEVYNLKLKTSREFYRKVQKSHNSMPFNLRSFDDEKKARLGVVECANHRLVDPFPVVYEKEGEFVAQFKATILLLPNSTKVVTSLPFDTTMYDTTYTIEDADLQKLVISQLPVSKSRKRRTKKNAQKKDGTDEPAAETKEEEKLK